MKLSSTLLVLSCLGTVAFGADADLSKLPPAARKDGLTYAKDVRPIFESTCFRCHGEQRQRGGLRLDTLESVLKGGKDGKVIVPGKSTESHLVLAVAQVDEKSAMPPKPRGGRPGSPGANGPGNPPPPNGGDGKAPSDKGGGGMGPMAKPLSPEQVGIIRAWVDQGAK